MSNDLLSSSRDPIMIRDDKAGIGKVRIEGTISSPRGKAVKRGNDRLWFRND